MPQKWNNGMVASGSESLRLGENVGPPEADQKDNSHFNFIVNLKTTKSDVNHCMAATIGTSVVGASELRLFADKVNKNILRGAAFFAFAWPSPHVFAVGLHIPGRIVVIFVNVQGLL